MREWRPTGCHDAGRRFTSAPHFLPNQDPCAICHALTDRAQRPGIDAQIVFSKHRFRFGAARRIHSHQQPPVSRSVAASGKDFIEHFRGYFATAARAGAVLGESDRWIYFNELEDSIRAAAMSAGSSFSNG